MSNPFNAGFAEGQATLPQPEWAHFGSFGDGPVSSNTAFGDWAAGLRNPWCGKYAGLEAYGRGFAS